MDEFELPPGRWQRQLTRLECDLWHVLGPNASPSSAAAALAHATALRQLELRAPYSDEPTQAQLRALLGALVALPAFERVEMEDSVESAVHDAHTALGSPLGERLQFVPNPYA